MPRLLPPLLLALLTAAPSMAHAQASPAGGQVTIYRCVAANGTVALRDSPCLKGERQEVRAMQRPRDPVPPPPAAAPAPAPLPATPAPPPARVVYLTPPRPMYECTAPDGQTYTSDSAEGTPRWVPFGSVVYPAWPRGGGGSVSGSLSVGSGQLSFESGDRRPPRPPGGHHPPRPGVVVPAGGMWVRDTCHPLPQQEICARLSDRRYEILRRYGAAMPSERRTLDLEQRGIDARMANDCR